MAGRPSSAFGTSVPLYWIRQMNAGCIRGQLGPSGLGHRLLGFDGAGALMAELVDGADGVAVGMAALDLCVVEGRGDNRLRRRNSLPDPAVLAAIDSVTGQVRICDRLPAQVDRWLRAGIAGCGHGGQSGGYGGRKDVQSLDAYGRGELTGELQRLPIQGDAGDVLGAILIDLAEANLLVQSPAGLFTGVHQQALLDRLGRRGEWALRGLGGERRQQLAVQADYRADWLLCGGVVGGPAQGYTVLTYLGR